METSLEKTHLKYQSLRCLTSVEDGKYKRPAGDGNSGEQAVGEWMSIVKWVNADDVKEWRPGVEAARGRGVRVPVLEAGIGKAEVRELARALGVPNWEKPALACLSSRIPYGTPVTIASLSQIEKAEAF